MPLNSLVLQPEPDPAWKRELRLIDPDLRIVWGWERILRNRWIIERKIPPERYFAMYASLLEADAPRYVDQPIWDHDQMILDADGNEAGPRLIGYRRFDLAPEYECMHVVEERDGSYKPFGGDDVLSLKKAYAWNRNHAFSRARYEEEQRMIEEKKQADAVTETHELYGDAYEQSYRASGRRVQTTVPANI